MASKVLFLFVSSDESTSTTLEDLLQVKLGTKYNCNTIKDILAEDDNLNDELCSSSCVLLIASKQSIELIKQQRAEKDCGGIVMFDGALVQQHMNERNLTAKMVVVQLGNGSDDNIPDGFDREKVFVVGENFDAQSPVLDQIVATIQGTISSKVNDKCAKKEKKKKKDCSQM
ncbi:hypothetical protein QZH41_005967 [Actinostola sp. cb2023]|nr:hypothetical protein QZH41_005967 [Actinostola sp. cb2023]